MAVVLASALIAASVATGAAAAEPTPRVLVVGDSLEELTSPYLQHYLPGVDLTVNAVGGSNSFQIFDLFQESYDPSQSVIVFDAGTNDNPAYPQILAGNLAKVAAIVGDRCMVVPTIHGYVVNGVDNSGKNRVVAEFAASRPGTETPDWAGFVAAHPVLMQSDGLHPSEAGAQERGRLIAEGILGCLTGAGSASSSAAAEGNGPVLEEAPEPIPLVGAIRAREQELIGSVGSALLTRTIASAGERDPLFAGAMLLLGWEAGGDA